ncbi:metallophosphoesterase [Rahnella aquatilis]|uniref:Calcineurin-like phosphoesterase domain-containing protein n=1 Tax=Rahnella aquatilis (strain ATCC 33071 / DSM 4594 / JCM 1683 / NBRC 105701 / NCIMB 13365 / CIP 78.65) TaxID=745277 RepID=H2J001_RAHAC|nr:metallophosphoesterase [Rahnella aquatilis]AEX52183.1 hypothetical protein Rahaq2_2329 [Rahnella aquatilis CIP 78.65 = ATCC 33071]
MIIAQVSDIHAAENNDNLARFERALSWIDFIAPDALVLTGDLIDDNWIPGNPSGTVGAHLPWLAENLTSDGPADSIVFMHHPVIRSGIPPLDQIMCGDVAKLAEFLSEHPRKPIAISAGHVHRSVVGQLAGIPAYICGSICPENPLWFGTEIVPPVNDSPSFMIHRYTESQLVSHPVLL